MKKSVPLSNKLCPQALYLYGTYREDGQPNFGLFCWFSYYWDGDLHVMACIGGEKLTKDRIHAGKVFSANLVSEPLLPLADYLGNTEGYASGKMDAEVAIEKGAVLDVPVLSDSPWVFELEVERSLPMDEGEIFLCKVRNVLVPEEIADETLSPEERARLAAPVVYMGAERYFSLNPVPLGSCGDWKR